MQAMARSPRLVRREAARHGVRVSVIIPVFNGLPYLGELLDSLDHQGLSRSQLQVIIVDDGSTDGTATFLDEYRKGRSHVTVLHQPNSGWPGQPRNRGLDLATGRWVFFADADDYLTSGALRELADFGDRHNAQVVLPRTGRVGTRRQGRSFRRTMIAAPKPLTFRTFMPHKLVRRSLIEDSGLRFPEGLVRLEDGIFFSRCYLLADRISILARREYYMLRGREDGGNISLRRSDPDSYTASLETIANNVYELSRSPELTTALITALIRRKCLRMYADRFDLMSALMQRRWLRAHQRFLSVHVTPEVKNSLSAANQRRLELVLAGDRKGLLALIAAQRANGARPARLAAYSGRFQRRKSGSGYSAGSVGLFRMMLEPVGDLPPFVLHYLRSALRAIRGLLICGGRRRPVRRGSDR